MDDGCIDNGLIMDKRSWINRWMGDGWKDEWKMDDGSLDR